MPRTTEADRIAVMMDFRDMLLANLQDGKDLVEVIAMFDRAIAKRLRRERTQ